ncbi:MAG: competence protein, ComGF family [Candidatus Campylobacter infans]|nr:MAG: competence protein, ComGF family [Candidatus Campylobacter infans]
MINAKLIEHIFKAASISRWNDYPKMMDLSELDKQSHKAIIAYFLAKIEGGLDMNALIECAIFDFLSRVVITDIRPDVLHYIQKNKANELNEWVLSKISPIIEGLDDGFIERLQNYLKEPNLHQKERKILKAASYLATRWEFNIVYQTSKFLSDIKELKAKVNEELEDYSEFAGVRQIAMNQKLARLVDLSGRLRFQKRWAQTQRIPQTSVLGHMLVVAILSYFYSLKVNACSTRLENNFFCALFHDLPESLTRDIISPVKYGVSGLDAIINEYEMRLIDEKILPLVSEKLRAEFAYILGVRQKQSLKEQILPNFNGDECELDEILGHLKDEKIYIKDEFENRILSTNTQGIAISGSLSAYNENKFYAIDGKALKACDKLAAFFEAGISISYGVSNAELKNGFKGVLSSFEKLSNVEGVDFLQICKDFKEHFGVNL